MDENIYNLHLDYLILAQEMVLAGLEQKAMFSLGLTPEAVAILKKMPSNKLKEIARSEFVSFMPRFNAGNWSKYLQNDNINNDNSHQALESTDSHARELLMFIPCSAGKS
jgi:hypothetical protein